MKFKIKIKDIMLPKILIFLCMAIMILLGGCDSASKVNTLLKINNDLSGERIMDISINNEVVANNYTGTIDDIKKIVDENIPEDLSYTYDDAGFHLKIEFTSLEDYKEKIKKITGEEKEIKITLPESVWSNGIYISENFSSSDLLKWFSSAMVSKGAVQSEYEQYITTAGDTYVEYGGEKYTTNANIYVDKSETLEISNIDMLLKVNALNNYDRDIVFTLPVEAAARKKTEIKEYFEEHKTENAGLEVKENDNYISYKLSVSNIDKDELLKFDKAVFGSDNVGFYSSESSSNDSSLSSYYFPELDNVDADSELQKGKSEKYISPFISTSELMENINFSSYLPGLRTTNVDYYVMADMDYRYKTPDSMIYYNFEDMNEDGKDKKYEGYVKITSQTVSGSSPVRLGADISKNYTVSYININTTKKIFKDTYIRDVEFILEKEDIDDETIKALIAAFESKNKTAETDDNKENKNTEAVFNVSTHKMKDKKTALHVHVEGTLDEIGEIAYKVFGDSGKFSYVNSRGFFKVRKYTAVVDSLSFKQMLGDEKISDDFKINYSFGKGIFSKIRYCSEPDNNFKKTFNKIETVYHAPEFNFTYVGTYIDFMSLLFYFFTTVFLISFIVLMFGAVFRRAPKIEVIKNDVMDDITSYDKLACNTGAGKELKAVNINKIEVLEDKTGKVITPDSAEIDDDTKADYIICSKCANRIPKDSRFCEKCGNKIN